MQGHRPCLRGGQTEPELCIKAPGVGEVGAGASPLPARFRQVQSNSPIISPYPPLRGGQTEPELCIKAPGVGDAGAGASPLPELCIKALGVGEIKKHFLVFSLAWATIVAVLSDILLISTFRSIRLDPEKGSSYAGVFLVPLAFSAANLLLIGGFSVFAVRVLRRRYHSLGGLREYAFFRNYVLILAGAAAANSVLLYNRYRAVMDILFSDEKRRINLMYSSEIPVRDKHLSELRDIISRYDTLALISAIVIALFKAAGYLFTARRLVRSYHKNARSGYSQEVRL